MVNLSWPRMDCLNESWQGMVCLLVYYYLLKGIACLLFYNEWFFVCLLYSTRQGMFVLLDIFGRKWLVFYTCTTPTSPSDPAVHPSLIHTPLSPYKSLSDSTPNLYIDAASQLTPPPLPPPSPGFAYLSVGLGKILLMAIMIRTLIKYPISLA